MNWRRRWNLLPRLTPLDVDRSQHAATDVVHSFRMDFSLTTSGNGGESSSNGYEACEAIMPERQRCATHAHECRFIQKWFPIYFFFRFFIGRVRWMDAAWLLLSTSQTRFSLHFSSFHFRIYFFFSICVHKKKKVFLICALRMRENAIDLENKMLMLGAGCDSGWNYCVRQVWIIVQQFWITVDRRGGLP